MEISNSPTFLHGISSPTSVDGEELKSKSEKEMPSMAFSEAPPTKSANWTETETTKLLKPSFSIVSSTFLKTKLLPAPIPSPDNLLNTDSNSTGPLELLEPAAPIPPRPMLSGTITFSDHSKPAALPFNMPHTILSLKLDKTPSNSTELPTVIAMVSPSTTLESSLSTTPPTSL